MKKIFRYVLIALLVAGVLFTFGYLWKKSRPKKVTYELVKGGKSSESELYDALAAHDTYLSAQKAVEAAQLAFDFEEQKYKAGRSNSYAFNQVRLRLGTARADEAQALYSFLFRAKILAFYNGISLTSTDSGL